MRLQQVSAVQVAPVKVPAPKVVVWEAFDAADPVTKAAGKLYEETLSADERIPWEWIERSIRDRVKAKPKSGGWLKHLLLAAPDGQQDDPESLAGYAYGAFLPGYGGYLCYVGVAEPARRLGVGRRLFEQFFKVLRVDAGELGESLPFVIWESHRPEPDASERDWDVWAARTRLFDRVGGLWVEGVNFLAPNFSDDEEDTAPVPLQLFLKPVDAPEESFTPERVREVVGGLHQRVYRNAPGTALFDGTLPPGCEPRLRPASEAE
ncbi:MAG TPA: GNAT family N-acetyltransferase [Gemmata sp.]